MPTSSSPASSSSLKTRSCSLGSRRYETGLASAFVMGKNRSARTAAVPFGDPASRPHDSFGKCPIAWATTSSLMFAGISITFAPDCGLPPSHGRRAAASHLQFLLRRLNLPSPAGSDEPGWRSAGGAPPNGDVAAGAPADNPDRCAGYSTLGQGPLERPRPLRPHRDQQPTRGLGIGQRQLLPLRRPVP